MAKKQPSLLDPVDDLAQVLGADLAKHFLDHRKVLKKPMTAFAASLMAKKLRTFPDPVASVEQSILKGWQDVFPVEPTSNSLKARVGADGRRMTAAEQTRENLMRQGHDLQQRRRPDTQGDGDIHLALRLPPTHGKAH